MQRHRARRAVIFLCLLSAGLTAVEAGTLVSDKRSSLLARYGLQEARHSGWTYFRKSAPLARVLADLRGTDKAALGLSPADVLVDDTTNAAEGVVRLRQRHRGLRVEGAELSVHHDPAQNVKLMHGALGRNLPSNRPALSGSQALERALARVAAGRYAWQSADFEAALKEDTGNANATHYPAAELLYARIGAAVSGAAARHRLAYRFVVRTLEPDDQREVVVDAVTGDVLRNRSLRNHAGGTVHTVYNGARPFTTYWRGFPYSDYVLKDQTRGEKLHTLGWSFTPWSLRSEIDDNDNTWYESAATAHWAVQKAWDYFRYRHGRNGLDNAGGKIRIEADYPDDSAFWRDGGYDYLAVGAQGNQGTLDIVGHEFSHGVDSHSRQLDFCGDNGEPGALDESFGDIFGVMTQAYVTGTFDWTIGEQTGTVIRSLEDPNSTTGADTYGGLHWSSTTYDSNCPEKYKNVGVQNFWFYLLARGGSGVNDHGHSYDVRAIGPYAAAAIAYRNLIVYSHQFSTYADAREGAINAARALYGVCSTQETATTNAWHAVGVGDAAGPCVGNIQPTVTTICVDQPFQPQSFTIAASPETAGVTWNVPYGFGSDISGDGRTLTLTWSDFTTPGVETISATVDLGGGSFETRYATLYLQECGIGMGQ
jgi:bacillolysin